MKRIFPILVVALMVLSMKSFAVAMDTKTAGNGTVDMAAGKTLFEQTCGKCHGLDRPLGKQKDRAGWEKTVDRMSEYHKRFGGPIPQDTRKAIVDYLVQVAGK
jgi:cytochrome c5